MSGDIGYFGGLVSDGMVLFMDAGKRASYQGFGTTWNSLRLGNNISGSLVNGPIFTTENNGGFTFDGTNDYLVGNSNLSSINNIITIIVVARVPNFNNRVVLFTKYQTTSPFGYAFEVGTASSAWTRTMRFYAQGFSDSVDYRGSVQLSDNTTYMFTAQLQSATLTKMYYNLTEMTATQANPSTWTTAVNWGSGNNFFYIGAYQPSVGVYGNSTIYNTIIYNKILSIGELTQNYNAMKTRFGLP